MSAVPRSFNIYPTKKETHTVKLFNFSDHRCYTSFSYITLKACHRLLHFTPFVCRSHKCRQENRLQTISGQFVKSQKKAYFSCAVSA